MGSLTQFWGSLTNCRQAAKQIVAAQLCYLIVWTTTMGLLAWLPAGWLFATAMRRILEKKGDPAYYLSAKDLSGIEQPLPRLGVVLAKDPIAELCEQPQQYDKQRHA